MMEGVDNKEEKEEGENLLKQEEEECLQKKEQENMAPEKEDTFIKHKVGHKKQIDDLSRDKENVSTDEELLQQEILNKLNLTTSKRKLMVATLLLLFGLFGMIYSIQAPFYPKEARTKNLTNFQHSFVFAAYEITGFLFSIPSGKVAHIIGPKLVVIFGLILTAFCCLSFGTIIYIKSGIVFFSVSVFIRILEGVGQIALQVGIMTIITTVLPASSSSVIAWTESMFGLGMIVAPAIGGVLYDAGGFLAPFEVMGALMFSALPVSLYIIPKDSQMKSISSGSQMKSWSILKIPHIWFGFFAIVVALMVLGFFNSTLEPHLESFHLSGSFSGLIFLLFGLGYAGSSPVWGMLCDKGVNPLYCICIGNIFLIIGISLVGPAPFLPFSKSLYLIIAGVIVTGVGMGGCAPTSFAYNKKVCIAKGYPNNVDTNSMLSGVFMSAITLGPFIGPILGGFLYDSVGFAYGSLAFIGCSVFSLIMTFVLRIIEARHEN